jgi:hypothetical protein
MECQRYPTGVKIIDNSKLPPLYLCFTEEEAACPQSQLLLDRVKGSLDAPGRIASLPAIAYVACLQRTRRRRVRGRGAELILRMMGNGIEGICLWALRLSLRGRQSTPELRGVR